RGASTRSEPAPAGGGRGVRRSRGDGLQQRVGSRAPLRSIRRAPVTGDVPRARRRADEADQAGPRDGRPSAQPSVARGRGVQPARRAQPRAGRFLGGVPEPPPGGGGLAPHVCPLPRPIFRRETVYTPCATSV